MKPKAAAKPAKAVEPSIADKQTEILWNLAAVVKDLTQVVKDLAAIVKELKTPQQHPDDLNPAWAPEPTPEPPPV